MPDRATDSSPPRGTSTGHRSTSVALSIVLTYSVPESMPSPPTAAGAWATVSFGSNDAVTIVCASLSTVPATGVVPGRIVNAACWSPVDSPGCAVTRTIDPVATASSDTSVLDPLVDNRSVGTTRPSTTTPPSASFQPDGRAMCNTSGVVDGPVVLVTTV